MNDKDSRGANPGVVGHVATTDTDDLAFRLKERIRKNGTQLVWIDDDGCILAVQVDSPAAKHVNENRLIGCYSNSAHGPRIASDIDVAIAEHATQAMRAHA